MTTIYYICNLYIAVNRNLLYNTHIIGGENILEFVARAVKTQVKWDKTTQRMGLDPVTGGRSEQNGENSAWTLNIQNEQ